TDTTAKGALSDHRVQNRRVPVYSDMSQIGVCIKGQPQGEKSEAMLKQLYYDLRLWSSVSNLSIAEEQRQCGLRNTLIIALDAGFLHKTRYYSDDCPIHN